jgi:vacuolar protein sorting-associated protein 13A/C
MWECKNNKIIEKRKKEIESFCESVLSDFAKKNEKTKDNSEEGYFSKLVMKIIDNLQITIKDIHIRYEDDLSKMEKR